MGALAFKVLGPALTGEWERGGVVAFFPAAAGLGEAGDLRTKGALGAAGLGEVALRAIGTLGAAALGGGVALRATGGLAAGGRGGVPLRTGTGLGEATLGGEPIAGFLPFDARSSSSMSQAQHLSRESRILSRTKSKLAIDHITRLDGGTQLRVVARQWGRERGRDKEREEGEEVEVGDQFHSRSSPAWSR